MIRVLDSNRIGYRFWYGRGLHRQPEYQNYPAECLATTEQLAARLIGLPFAVDMTPAEIRLIVSSLASA